MCDILWRLTFIGFEWKTDAELVKHAISQLSPDFSKLSTIMNHYEMYRFISVTIVMYD